MTQIKKVETYSVYKHFEAPSLEAAIEMAKVDESGDWKFTEDDSAEYFVGEEDD